MFPKQASKLYSERVNAVVNAVELISSPSCTFSDAEKRSYVQVRIDALPVIPKEDAVGLRIDLELEDPATERRSGSMLPWFTLRLRVIANVSSRL